MPPKQERQEKSPIAPQDPRLKSQINMPDTTDNSIPHVSHVTSVHGKSNGTRRQLVFKGHFSKAKIDEIRLIAIKKILSHIGFEVEDMENNDGALDHLLHVTDIFLISFVERMRFHKDSKVFCESQDLWDTLETTLQEWGLGGVCGIAKYFYEEGNKIDKSIGGDDVR